jgi:short-subunit dehydrogenase
MMLCKKSGARTYAAALVTGASSGIGTAFARALPPETDLVLTGRDGEALSGLAAELMHEGRRIEVVQADLATDTGPAAVIEAADAFGIDLLINNAGLGRFGPHLTNPAEAEALTVRVNAEATTRLCRGLLPGMLARAKADRRRAGVVNMASTVAFAPVPQFAVYAASKAFVVSYTEALQAELAREPVDLLLALPGSVATSFGQRAGYQGGRLPGVITPETVVGKVLGAIGRQKVVYTDFLSEKGLGPVSGLRGLGAMGIATGLGVFERLQTLRR